VDTYSSQVDTASKYMWQQLALLTGVEIRVIWHRASIVVCSIDFVCRKY